MTKKYEIIILLKGMTFEHDEYIHSNIDLLMKNIHTTCLTMALNKQKFTGRPSRL